MPFVKLTKSEAKESIKERIEAFRRNLQYFDQSYKEGRLETEYLEPFFQYLGWDVSNQDGISELYKDVIKRASVEVEGHLKEPDYSFTIGGKPAFLVEAKKPSENIHDNNSYSFQLRRYAYSAKIPISILTSFKEFAVYDCRVKPNKDDRASVARIYYGTFEEILTNFDFIYDTFSREGIRRDSLKEFIKKAGQSGTSEVDDEFLLDLENWREKLAKNIATLNKDLSVNDLNLVVQKILDRILFLRIAEDRYIEPYGRLKNIAKSNNIYRELINYFKEENDKFNSGLFDLDTDQITPSIKISKDILASIIDDLYYPSSPYVFKVLKIEILGSAYERFLGKTIKLTESHKVRIEDKPEVKKAGGIYYTPSFVVDYIVKNTINELLKGKTPKDVEKIRILDPACGSGTFLVRAYSNLLDWHLNYYLENQTRYRNKIYLVRPEEWALTTEVRKSILLNNIFGVDIDQQAVEITKLSLLLKVLENETKESVNRQLKLVNERVLPNIDNNIRCGNSLVDHTYFSQLDLTDDRENWERIQKVNPFDWSDKEKGYGYLTEGAKFDVIIGNPPYVKEYTSREPFEQVKQTNLRKYYQGKMDLWYIFTCKAIDLLKEGGLHSFIALNNWVTNAGASIMRQKILTETKLLSFLDFNQYQIFKKKASNQTMVFVLKKEKITSPYKLSYAKVIGKNITEDELTRFLNSSGTSRDIASYDVVIDPVKLNGNTIAFVGSDLDEILTKIDERSNYSLSDDEVSTGIDIHQDFVTDKHIKYLKDPSLKGSGIFNLSNREYLNLGLNSKEKDIVKPFYGTDQLFRYYGNSKNSLWVIYSDKQVRDNIDSYPHIKEHLEKFKKVITSDFGPYGLHRARESKFFEGEKIVSLRKTLQPRFTYTDFPCYVSQTYFVLKPSNIDLKYLTGLLNSNVIFFWLKYRGKRQGEQLQIDKQPLMKLPLYLPDVTVHSELKYRDEIINATNGIIDLTKDLIESRSESNKAIIEMKIKALEDKINNAVYLLYGITEEEQKIIEGKL